MRIKGAWLPDIALSLSPRELCRYLQPRPHPPNSKTRLKGAAQINVVQESSLYKTITLEQRNTSLLQTQLVI